MPQPTLEDVIVEQASVVCDQIETAADFAESEEDLRIEFERAIDQFRQQANLPKLKGHHEVTIGKGRADSVYDYVVIEYKKPGRLTNDNSSPGNKEVIKQLKQRLRDFEKEEGKDITEIFGVGTDGHTFIFARYRSGAWDISRSQERSVQVVETFLRRLASLGVAGKPFQADYLAGDFSAESPRNLARDGIATLYWRVREIEKNPDDYPKAKVLFDQWRILFGEVCGYDINTPSSKIKKLGEFYGVKKDPNAASLLFSVHTYYALFMKFLAAEIATAFNPLAGSFLAILHQTGSKEKLREELRTLEDGGIYAQLGLRNFLEGDLFSWYLDAWNEDVEHLIRQMVACFDEYDPKSLSVDPAESRDLLKKLYQQLFPRTLRHDLGEYYTPDWLAELVIERVGYNGNPDKRVLDPACGSGTFLVMAINKVREYADANMIPKHELLPKILENVIGFDLNPLAVMAARTNYLLALRDLLKLGAEIHIPVYLCDSIMTPAEYGKEELLQAAHGKVHELKTAAARFFIPQEIARDRQTVEAYTRELEHCVRNDYSGKEFVERLKSEGIPCAADRDHQMLYDEVRKLRKLRKNDIWARIIKNSFAPLFIKPVDYVIGNPPWVNWESLPADYRDSMKPLWERYGLFSLSGSAGRLGGGKKDLAMLFVYCGIDEYLKRSGKLGFVITQTVFKTKGAGDGFRRFHFKAGKKDVYIKPRRVDDLSSFQPFEGATNRTAVFVCQKVNRAPQYPVTYVTWSKKRRAKITQESTLEEVRRDTLRRRQGAVPVDANQSSSPWLTAPKTVLTGIQKVIGKSEYQAYAGCCTWLNGVYWVQVLGELDDEHLLIENLHDVGKIKVPKLQVVVEKKLVYPLLRGRDVQRWKAEPSAHIILTQDPQTRTGIPEQQMKQKYPKTYAYLKKFEEQLRQRSGYRKYFDPKKDAFWSMYNVSSDTLAPYKVLWRDMGTDILCSVVGTVEGRIVLPEHHVMAVSFDSPSEAHYLCALLSSSPARCVVASYTTTTGISTHVLDNVSVPTFNPRNGDHRVLSEFSTRCHKAAAAGDQGEVAELEGEIDRTAAKIWGITDDELKAIQDALQEMERPKGRRSEGTN